MAQDFQDLTGQVIKKIIAVAQELETELMGVLIETMPGERRTDSVISLLNGPVIDAAGVVACIAAARRVFVHHAVKDYLVAIVHRTRSAGDLRLGASPRASLQLLRVAKAQAAIGGRLYVTPDDIQALAVPTLAHRVLLSHEGHLSRRDVTEVIRGIVADVPVPQRRA